MAKYVAFISYSSADTDWGRRLQRKLEAFRLPTSLCKEKGRNRYPLRPVFFAPSDFQPGGLSEELKNRLQESMNLIVLCSPSSAQSAWVKEEIRYFHSLGRQDSIYLFIIKGTPNSGDPDSECFPPVLKELGIPEILGANIHEKAFRSSRLNRERAYFQIISKLLGVDFDVLWKRNTRLIRKRAALGAAYIALIAIVLCFAVRAGLPVDASLVFREVGVSSGYLPKLGDIHYSILLGDERIAGQTDRSDTVLILHNIPRRSIGQAFSLSARTEGFFPIDTVLMLFRKTVIPMRRNPETYGRIRFILWNPAEEKTAPGAEVIIEGNPARADENGIVSVFIPLERQKTTYSIISSVLQFPDTLVRPSAGEGYAILFTPKAKP